MTPYYVEIFADSGDPRRRLLSDAIEAEIRRLGVHRTVSVEMTDPPLDRQPSVGVYFGGPRTAADSSLVLRALEASRPVIPVVDDGAEYRARVPRCLWPVNGYVWDGPRSAAALTRMVLEELGIEDRQRRAFISHRRQDGLAAAEQLHEELSRHGFRPFIDRFHIAPGRDIQAEIADQLEDCALVVLLESPLAHQSEWVFDEVDYALSHQLGVHIVTWPGVTGELPGTAGLPRQHVDAGDLGNQKGFDIFTPSALDRIVSAVEAEHARALVRRRRYLMVSAEEAALDAGQACLPLPGWRMLVKNPAKSSIVQVTPRLPTVDDLYALDQARMGVSEETRGVIVHAARRLSDSRRAVLAWASQSRELALVPENAIGGYWRTDAA